MRTLLFVFLLTSFSLSAKSQAIIQPATTATNNNYGPLIYLGLTEEDKSTITWDGKNIVFPCPLIKTRPIYKQGTQENQVPHMVRKGFTRRPQCRMYVTLVRESETRIFGNK